MGVLILDCCKVFTFGKVKLLKHYVIPCQTFFTVIPLYGRKDALRRKPLKVITKSGKNLTDGESTYLDPVIPLDSKLAFSRWDQHRIAKIDSKDKPPVLKFENAKENIEKFTNILTTVKSQKERENTGKVLLEGVRLINDALSAGAKPEMILFSRLETLSKLRIPIAVSSNIKIYKVLYRTLQVWSSLKTSPGIIAIFKKPSGDEINALTQPALPVTVICHNITDAGKMGTIIRSAAAVGCQSILLMKGCVDAWMHSVLRSSCGANFRIPIISNIEWTHILNYMSEKTSLYLINNGARSKSLEDGINSYVDFSEDWESEEVLQEVNEESSDADAQSEDELERESSETTITSARFRTVSENQDIIVVDKTYEDAFVEKYSDVYVPKLKYSDAVFPKQDIALFISDNSLTLDAKAVKLSCEFGGRELKIPLENDIKQLSPSITLSIVLYEIRRQIAEKYVLL